MTINTFVILLTQIKKENNVYVLEHLQKLAYNMSKEWLLSY